MRDIYRPKPAGPLTFRQNVYHTFFQEIDTYDLEGGLMYRDKWSLRFPFNVIVLASLLACIGLVSRAVVLTALVMFR